MSRHLISEDFDPLPKWLHHGRTISIGLAYSLLHESSLTHAVANTRIVISSRQLSLAHCVRVSRSSFLFFNLDVPQFCLLRLCISTNNLSVFNIYVYNSIILQTKTILPMSSKVVMKLSFPHLFIYFLYCR